MTSQNSELIAITKRDVAGKELHLANLIINGPVTKDDTTRILLTTLIKNAVTTEKPSGKTDVGILCEYGQSGKVLTLAFQNPNVHKGEVTRAVITVIHPDVDIKKIAKAVMDSIFIPEKTKVPAPRP